VKVWVVTEKVGLKKVSKTSGSDILNPKVYGQNIGSAESCSYTKLYPFEMGFKQMCRASISERQLFYPFLVISSFYFSNCAQ